MTQTELARLIGVSQNTVSKWERGHGRPAGARLSAVLRVLAIDPADYAATIHDDAIAQAIEHVAAAIDRLGDRLISAERVLPDT